MKITVKTAVESTIELKVTIDEANRVLELGRLLLSSLTPEELKELQRLLYGEVFLDHLNDGYQIGNTGVT